MVLEKFAHFGYAIKELNDKIKEIERERIEWCRNNRDAIKSVFPKSGKIYKVVDLSILGNYVLRQLEDLTDEYYFEPQPNQKFNPANNWFFHSGSYPRVKGTLIDCNFRRLDIGDFMVGIDNIVEVENVKDANRKTNVYVMIDKNTGMYKIGRSVNPTARERTLQSEKPTIEMLFSAPAMVSDEKVLHDMFDSNRVRGEWFDLNSSQLAMVKEYFNANSK